MNVFDEVIDRRLTNSVKWDGLKMIYGQDDLLPMWVADMDFASPKEIQRAIMQRAEHSVYGYSMAPEEMNKTVCEWVEKRYNFKISEKWLVPSPGVVSGIAFAIQALTEEGDKVLIQTPVYAPFYSIIENNRREIVTNPLRLVDGKYEMDFDDFERKLKQGVKLFVLCNPHNPVGRVWTKEELKTVGNLCKKYGVYIISDEIHGDIIYKPNVHHPIAALNDDFLERTITCIAPSKTFNIPGLQASMMIIAEEELRKKVRMAQSKIGYHGFNLFGSIALTAAYAHGEKWLEQLLDYLQGNVELATTFINEEIPELTAIQPEGTYLLWIDCRKLGLSDDELKDALLNKGKLALEPGKKYGKDGEGFVRMNIGCPRSTLEEGLRRLKLAFSKE